MHELRKAVDMAPFDFGVHPAEKSTSSFCPSAPAHLCSVASVRFSITHKL
jgi:hypothetical protein